MSDELERLRIQLRDARKKPVAGDFWQAVEEYEQAVLHYYWTCPDTIAALREYGEKQKAAGFVEGFDRAKEADDDR